MFLLTVFELKNMSLNWSKPIFSQTNKIFLGVRVSVSKEIDDQLDYFKYKTITKNLISLKVLILKL